MTGVAADIPGKTVLARAVHSNRQGGGPMRRYSFVRELSTAFAANDDEDEEEEEDPVWTA
jgi:hypothetical protein